MGIEISSIKDANLNSIAKQADTNKDNKLSGDEYQIFAQIATNAGVDYKTIGDTLQMNAFERWWFDVDKVATDGKDDGKLSAGEIAESSAKGFFGGLIKGMVKNPITTAVTLGLGTVATIATGGAALPILVGLGAGVSAISLGSNIYKYAKADNDLDAKNALEGAGTATLGLALSAFGVKAANKAGANAGIKSLQGLDKASYGKNVTTMFKSMPEAFKVSGQNIKGNVLTWTTGTVHAHSNQLQGAELYMSKANDVQAYRFNPNGTPEEVIANNPGVFRGSDGKYYLPNKWSPKEPYLIDPSKEQMIMLYGGDDMAVCDGAIFKGSYVDTEGFNATQALNYQDPSKLAYGEVVNVTKQAPGAFKVMPEGTKIQTLEGVRTVGEGEVVALDHAGNPYATTPANILKRNTGFSTNAESNLITMAIAAKNKQYLSNLKANAKTTIRDSKNVPLVESRIDKYSDLVIKLSDSKMSDGTARFTMEDINTLLLNVRESELNKPSTIFNAIAEADKYGYEKGAFGVWKCLYY